MSKMVFLEFEEGKYFESCHAKHRANVVANICSLTGYDNIHQ